MKTLLLSLSLMISVTAWAENLTVTDVRVKEPIPGRYMSAGFLTLSNSSDQDIAMISASAPWAGLIEIHTHLHENGMMKMRQLDKLVIPAGETVSLQPGGLHLMLFRLQLPLAESLPMTLCFDNDECISAQARLFSPHQE